MKTFTLFIKVMTIAAFVLFLDNCCFAQTDTSRQRINERDTIYFLDGRVIAANITERDSPELIKYSIWDGREDSFMVQGVRKSMIHYIFIYDANEYILITENSSDHDFERLRYNMLRYQRQSRAGMITLSSGVGLVLMGTVFNEIQQSKFQESFDPDDINDLPKYLKYAGYGTMLVGGMIKIGSYKFLERGSVDITPVGVRVNF